MSEDSKARDLSKETPYMEQPAPAGQDWRRKVRHDLRTPVNQIIGYSEMLQEDAQTSGQTDFIPDLQKISKAARSLLAGIETLLTSESAPAPPVSEASPPEGVHAEGDASRVEDSDAPAGGPEFILVVDDNEMNRDMLSGRLKRRGYRVSTAEDGYNALNLVEAQEPDLILLDIMMPGLSGYDVLKTVREKHSPSDLPIIMATAKGEGEDIVAGFKLGANDYVTKPIDFPVALVRVETQLALKRAMEEVRVLAGALERRNKFIRKTFGRYLSEEVVDILLDTPEGLKLGGEKRTVTVLMSDLRGFSAVSESLPPEQVVIMLNHYLGTMSQIIGRYHGTIDEFIGDAILAIFGAPLARADDAERAVACALAMQLAMDSVNETNCELGLPEIQMGIAVNTGEVVVGNIGSQERSKYGIVGSRVNLTGRIESCTVGGQILIAQSTMDAVGNILEAGEKMTVEAKGFKVPVVVHDVRGIAGRHNLRLHDRKVVLRSLVRSLPLRVRKLEGKHVCREELGGSMVRLSLEEGEMSPAGEHGPARLAPMDDVRVRFMGPHGAQIPGGLYAKVTCRTPEGYKLRFTSVAPELKAFIQNALSKLDG